MNFEDAIKNASKARMRLITNPLVDFMLSASGTDPNEKFKFWTGTVCAYPAARERVGRTLEYYDVRLKHLYVLDTADFIGEKGVAFTFSDFDLQTDGSSRIYVPNDLRVIQKFPQEDGWYGVDKESGIPVVDPAALRYLWRSPEKKITPVVRDTAQWACKELFLNRRPSHEFFALMARIESDSLKSGLVSSKTVN